MEKRTWVYKVARFEFEGKHACIHPVLGAAEQEYPHRHVFQVEVCKWVNPDCHQISSPSVFRDTLIEYIRNYFAEYTIGCVNLIENDCEDICKILCDKFDLSECEVLEDGSSGCKMVVKEVW